MSHDENESRSPELLTGKFNNAKLTQGQIFINVLIIYSANLELLSFTS